MASIYRFRFHKSSYSIAIDLTIDLTAEVVPWIEGAQPVADNVYLCVDVPRILTVEERASLVQGLRLVAEKLQATLTPDAPIVVRVLALDFNECDYQPEGLACAMAGWAAYTYGFEPPNIKVTFDRRTNHCQFYFSAKN